MPTTDEERLLISLEARLAKYEREMARATQISTRTSKKIEADFARLDRSLSRVGSGLARGLAGPIAGLLTVQGVTETVDAYVNMTNALKAAGIEGADLVRVQKELFAIAERQSQPVDDLTKLYGSLALTAQDLGASQDDLLQLTERVAAALRVSGASGSTAAGALQQFGQALASGRVEAEEFGSILDGTPEIARAVARGLDEAGGSVAKLRSLIKDGQVSSQEFYDAFLAGSDQTLIAAGKMEKTLGTVFTDFRNQMIAAVGGIDGLDAGLGFISDSVKQFATDLTTVITDLIRYARELKAIYESIRPPQTAEEFAKQQGAVEGNQEAFESFQQSVKDLFVRLTVGGSKVDQFADRFLDLALKVGEARKEMEEAAPGPQFENAKAKVESLAAAYNDHRKAAIGMFIAMNEQIAEAEERLAEVQATAENAFAVEDAKNDLAELQEQLARMEERFPAIAVAAGLVTAEFDKWKDSINTILGRLGGLAGALGGIVDRLGLGFGDAPEAAAVSIDKANAATKRWIDTTADYLKLREGFADTAYWDRTAFRIGYGSDTITDALGRISPVAEGMKTTVNDALRDLERRITTDFAPAVIRGIGPQVWEGLTEDAKAALVSLTYNYGTASDAVQAVFKQVAAGNMAAAADLIESYRAHNEGINATRREQEAALLRGTATVAELASASKRAAEEQADADRQAADAKRDLSAAIAASTLSLERQAQVRQQVAEIEARGAEFARNAAYVAEYEIALAERLAEAKEKNIELTSEQMQAIYAEADAKARLAEQDVALAEAEEAREAQQKRIVDEQQRVTAALEQVGGAFEDAFVDAILSGEKLSDVLKNLAKTLLEMMLRAQFQNLFGGLFGAGSPLGGILGPLFGGARQHGGPVSAGQAYVVGEKRPELFVPKVPGTIVPSVPRGIGAPATASVSGQVRGVLDIAPSPLFMVGVRAVTGEMIAANNRALPGYLSERQRRGV